jgi:hypothetical protein
MYMSTRAPDGPLKHGLIAIGPAPSRYVRQLRAQEKLDFCERSYHLDTN